MKISLKRAYDTPSKKDGRRILVDRIWPRGVSKDDAQIDEWFKEIAPSSDLRKWFGHDPQKWASFKKQYAAELKDKKEELGKLLAIIKKDHTTFIYAAKDPDHNNAVALKEYIEKKAK